MLFLITDSGYICYSAVTTSVSDRYRLHLEVSSIETTDWTRDIILD